MHPALSAEVETLVNLGWSPKGQSETTASLETRGPFNWWIFLFALLLFFGAGGMIYILYWLIFSRSDLFLRMDDGNVRMSGDTWLLERQRADVESAIRIQREVKEKGFWKAAWPSLLAALVVIGIWLLIIWGFVALVR